MRVVYIVCYDISDPRRLRKVFRAMKGAGDHLQLSVFLCRLSDRQKARLQAHLREIVDPESDQVLFVPVCPEDNLSSLPTETVGLPMIVHPRQAAIF